MKTSDIRRALIASVYSDEEADSYFLEHLHDPNMLLTLCNICAPHDEFTNDPRMQAAFYISQYPAELLVEVFPLLVVLLTMPPEDGAHMNGNIAEHLIAAIEKSRHLYKCGVSSKLDEVIAYYNEDDEE